MFSVIMRRPSGRRRILLEIGLEGRRCSVLRSRTENIFFYARGTMFRFALLLIATSALASDKCTSARQDVDKFLAALPTACKADSDCTGRYFGTDACAPPVVTNKEKFTDNHHLFLLQKAVRVACGTQDKPRPACSPIPFRATCRQNKCVDTLKEDIAALPKGPYRFGTINHSCGPADGPALDIRLTPSKAVKTGPS